MVPLRAAQKTLAILGIALACAVGASLLPSDPYQRWQLLDGTIHSNARWIYERVHDDATPIDIVFLGPSRMGAGVDAPRLQDDLAARGLAAHVVNFSLPETGRNINAAVAEQLFKTKKPELVILGVIEKPSRFGHSAFKYVADPADVAAPGYLGDIDYFSDLIYLPFRQMRLFAADLLPGGFGLAKTFDRAHYRGPSVDTTGSIVLPDGRVKDGEKPADPQELMRGVRKLESGNHPPFLPRALADIEFGDERHYVAEIAGLAKDNGAKLAFLYLPYHTGPTDLDGVQELDFYRQFGPVWNAGFLSPHAELYADYAHLTRSGANTLTDWLAQPIAEMLKNRKTSS